MRTVAEGVETAEQAQRLRELGADLAQGYWYGRAQPASAFTPLLERERAGRPRIPELARYRTRRPSASEAALVARTREPDSRDEEGRGQDDGLRHGHEDHAREIVRMLLPEANEELADRRRARDDDLSEAQRHGGEERPRTGADQRTAAHRSEGDARHRRQRERARPPPDVGHVRAPPGEDGASTIATAASSSEASSATTSFEAWTRRQLPAATAVIGVWAGSSALTMLIVSHVAANRSAAAHAA